MTGSCQLCRPVGLIWRVSGRCRRRCRRQQTRPVDDTRPSVGRSEVAARWTTAGPHRFLVTSDRGGRGADRGGGGV